MDIAVIGKWCNRPRRPTYSHSLFGLYFRQYHCEAVELPSILSERDWSFRMATRYSHINWIILNGRLWGFSELPSTSKIGVLSSPKPIGDFPEGEPRPNRSVCCFAILTSHRFSGRFRFSTYLNNHILVLDRCRTQDFTATFPARFAMGSSPLTHCCTALDA